MLPETGSRGVTLVELLVAMVLGTVLLGGAVTLLGTLSRATRQAVARWDNMEAVRTVWVTTERELRPGVRDRDWEVTDGGVLRLRAFRGLARVCGAAVEPGVYPVLWRGDRQPVPDQDSVVVLGADGGWRQAALTAWLAGGPCLEAEGERSGRMAWEGAGSEPPVLVRVFERGAYSFYRGAFRYERGAAGRQPLTPEVFEDEVRYEADSLGVIVTAGLPPGVDGGWVRIVLAAEAR